MSARINSVKASNHAFLTCSQDLGLTDMITAYATYIGGLPVCNLLPRLWGERFALELWRWLTPGHVVRGI